METTINHKVKQSFTIESNNLKMLSQFGNKSKIVNEALTVFFERTAYLERAEEDFWREKIEKGLLDVKEGRTTTINPSGEKITREMLEKTLWS